MHPYFDDSDLRLYQGDAVEVLRELPAGSVHMACTSPPFFGLRDYQAEGQIGLESSPDEWAARLVDVFREVRRVLRDDGTLWVECGDSYCADTKWGGASGGKNYTSAAGGISRDRQFTGHKTKDLLGAPWLLAFALRADGWYLRSCIIWSKPNAMPESVTDRPTTGHSYVFLFSKKPRYFYDAEALREPAEWARWGDQTVPKHEGTETASGWIPEKSKDDLSRYLNQAPDRKQLDGGFGVKSMGGRADPADGGKNARTVWTIPTEPNALAICRVCDAYWQGGAPREHCGEPVVQHFAAFPRELVRRMILAGTSERGVCAECGAPWVREIRRVDTGERQKMADGWDTGAGSHGTIHRNGREQGETGIPVLRTETRGWVPMCKCQQPATRYAETVPATILDPFSGSGTTLLVARSLGRHAIGVELNERYCAMTKARTHQLSVLG